MGVETQQVVERDAESFEVGAAPRNLADIVLGVVRGGQLLRADAPDVGVVKSGDKLLHLRLVSD